MLSLARPSLPPDSLNSMPMGDLRELAKGLRVHSHLDGAAEFAKYADESISREKWRAAILAPPTTTTQVQVCIIQPATKSLPVPGSYATTVLKGQCDASTGRSYVGAPTDFVSHAWRYNFKDLVSALLTEAKIRDKQRAQRGLPPIAEQRYYWNDIFVEDQTGTKIRPEGYFFDAFRSAVSAIGRTVLVLQPLREAIPLTRA